MPLSDKFGRRIEYLLYLTPPSNIGSILRHGILSYNKIRSSAIPHTTIANPFVQARRNRVVFGLPLHDYVPLYLARRNPMLWAVHLIPRAYIRIALQVADKEGVVFSDGNSASATTCFFQAESDADRIPWNVVCGPRWTGSYVTDGRRKRCAEVLVPHCIEKDYILDVKCMNAGEIEVDPDHRRYLCEDPGFLNP